jgi:hypothetical protein
MSLFLRHCTWVDKNSRVINILQNLRLDPEQRRPFHQGADAANGRKRCKTAVAFLIALGI